ncbi:hypothetical protein CFOL_v3_30453, partial [Cephalotus follicularis]
LSSSCHHCRGKGPGWSYRSQCKTINLHVLCAKELRVDSWQAMHLKVDRNKVRGMQTRIPGLKGTSKNHHARRGKVSQIAGGAAHLIVPAILGDPTVIISAVIGGFLS